MKSKIQHKKIIRNTAKLVHLLAFLAVQVKVGFLWVVAALAEFVACELVVACSALELDDAGEKLPEEISPGNFLSSQRQHEFIELEAFVSDVR